MATHVCCQIFAGCYERTVFGYDFVEEPTENDVTYSLRASFTNNAHTGCIKALAASSRFLASGSTDEIINLYDLEENVELGSLMQHDGSITSLSFHGDDHMMSGGEDGVICVWGTQAWDCMKIMKGHKAAVHAVTVHQSGKLALSVSQDKTLRTWNLLKGRAAYTTNIKKVSDLVMWSPDGQLYAIVIDNQVDIYDITTATVCCSFESKKRILSACFITDRVLTVGGEGELITFLRVNDNKTSLIAVQEFRAHKNRIKSLKCICASGSRSKETEKWLLSASSDGFIKVWCIDTEKVKETPSLLAEVNTKARLTCLAARKTAPKTETSEAVAAKRPLSATAGDSTVKKKKKSKP